MKTLIIESNASKLKSHMLLLLQDKNNSIVGIQDSYDALSLLTHERFDIVILGESLNLTECLYLVQTCHLREDSKNLKTPIKSLSKSNQTLKQIHRPNKFLSFYFSESAIMRIKKSMQTERQQKNNCNYMYLAG